jgi:hypothetical protein
MKEGEVAVGIFTFLDENKNIIEQKSVLKLDYKEDLIIQYSIKMFLDEDPCIIHRTYAVNKIGFDLLDILEKEYKEEVTFSIDELPDFIKDKVNYPEGTKYVKIS